MTHRIRHLPRSILRSSALLLLLLCLIAQPVLAAWGEMHELTAHPHSSAHDSSAHDSSGQDSPGQDASSRDSAPDHRSPHSHAAMDDSGSDDADDPVHALSHHAHCCGQPQLPFLSQLPLPAFEVASMMPWPATMRPIAASHSATPFRPPIPG